MVLPVLLIFRGNAQSLDKIKSALISEGFENVRVIHLNDQYYISIENQEFRWDVRAVSTALKIISEQTEKPVRVKLLLLDKDIPRNLIEFNSADWKQFPEDNFQHDSLEVRLSVSENTGEAWELIRKVKPERRSQYKTDLVLFPQFTFENTLKARLYTGQFNIAPAIRLTLLRGMQFSGQVILPLYNELGYEGNFVRPGQVILSQEFKFKRLSGKVAVGNFSSFRYGGDISLRYFLPDENWNIKLNAGLTGSSHFLEYQWKHTTPKTLTGSLSASWFIPRFNMEAEGGIRKYIYGDTGIFGSLTRWFGETAFGFYALYSRVSVNGGFHFSFPFPDRKRPRGHFFRVTIPDHQDMVYNAGTEFYFGQTYRTGPETNMIKGFYRAGYMRNEILRTNIESIPKSCFDP